MALCQQWPVTEWFVLSTDQSQNGSFSALTTEWLIVSINKPQNSSLSALINHRMASCHHWPITEWLIVSTDQSQTGLLSAWTITCVNNRYVSVDKGVSTDLIAVCADDEDGGFGRVAGYRAKPEVQPSVFESLTCGPQQQVNGSLGQEKLERKSQFCYTHTHTHTYPHTHTHTHIPTHLHTHHTHTHTHLVSVTSPGACPAWLTWCLSRCDSPGTCTVTHLVSVHLSLT